jgi:hypothetical protein
MDGLPEESNRTVWKRLNIQLLRKPISPDETDTGVQSLVCGNSAVPAVAPVIGADAEDVASSIALTAILGVIVVNASLAPSEVMTRDERRAFGDCIADYNPLGQFGAAWNLDSWSRQPNDR